MKNELFAALYRYYRWPLDHEFIHGLKNTKDEKSVREYFLFHPKLDGVDKKEIYEHLNYVETEIEIIKQRGWKISYPGACDYPDAFLHLNWPPTFLSYIGEPAWTLADFISIVGSREPTRDAIEWMQEELPKVLHEGYGFVSGAARGIDQIAHKICLQSESRTVAFLPAGLEHIYPKDFSYYISDIIQSGGTIVSEYLPSTRMNKGHFYERNRLIAFLGTVLLVVQAKIKSGSMLTARYAQESTRQLAAVPWDPRDIHAMGTNQLLFEGAHVVRSAEDLIGMMELELAGKLRGCMHKSIIHSKETLNSNS